MRIRSGIWAVALTTLVLSAPASARKYGSAGCGLGSLVMGKGGGQISAATTNGTSSNQALGITSGTLNCKPDKRAMTELRQEQFLAANFHHVSKEISQGGGETVAALAETFGCESQAVAGVTTTLQTNYNEIFAAPGVVASLETMRAVLRPQFAQQCTQLL